RLRPPPGFPRLPYTTLFRSRFVMTFPNEQLWAGRPLRMAPAYDAMTEAGAQWGVSYGLEVPIYFAPKGFEETPTLRRSNAFDIVDRKSTRLNSSHVKISYAV